MALTRTESARRTALLQVESYQIVLDLSTSTGTGAVRSRTEVRFSCREPGATTFADIDALAVHEAVLNGAPADPAAITDGRLPLTGLAAANTLTVDATVAMTTSGSGLTQYTDPADGSRYVLANCFPTAAPRVFCCGAGWQAGHCRPDWRAISNCAPRSWLRWPPGAWRATLTLPPTWPMTRPRATYGRQPGEPCGRRPTGQGALPGDAR